MHEASNAATLLEQIGGPPSIRLVSYGDDGAAARTAGIGAALTALASAPRYDAGLVDMRTLEPTSACALAGRLAGLLERCVA
jgi:hypothetical protein